MIKGKQRAMSCLGPGVGLSGHPKHPGHPEHAGQPLGQGHGQGHNWAALSWLFPTPGSRRHPRFPVLGEEMAIIEEPKDFFSKLKELAEKSKKRITISSLYMGTKEMEKELVSTLESSLEANPELKMTLLLDYTRGNRINSKVDFTDSSRCLLRPLVQKKAQVSFYLSPNFSKMWNKRVIFPSEKWNEIISLQHIKCYLFDDNLIVSGANLSDQYFTNRKDRYICFYNCKPLCDYFDELVQTISTFSLQLSSSGDYALHSSWAYHPLLSSHRASFIREARKRITLFQDKFAAGAEDNALADTFVVPLLQMRTFGVNDDELFTSNLLSNSPPSAVVKLASGYFNLTHHYMELILKRPSTKKSDILMASEQVNGFYGAKGLAGRIPSVYTHLGRIFLKEAQSRESKISLWSFTRPKWTFHAKGLWIQWAPDYMLTTIGSPNFGYRSVFRDLEAQVVVVTREAKLKRRLVEEYENLWKFSAEVKNEKELPSVPFWVQWVAKIMKSYF